LSLGSLADCKSVKEWSKTESLTVSDRIASPKLEVSLLSEFARLNSNPLKT
jgi:hypothetical protein